MGEGKRKAAAGLPPNSPTAVEETERLEGKLLLAREENLRLQTAQLAAERRAWDARMTQKYGKVRVDLDTGKIIR